MTSEESSLPPIHMLQTDGTTRPMSSEELSSLEKKVRENLAAQPIQHFTLKDLSGFCPVQAEGTIDGIDWYFRARWDGWSFDVEADGGWVEKYRGDYLIASWMPLAHALKIIAGCVGRYAAEKRKRKT